MKPIVTDQELLDILRQASLAVEGLAKEGITSFPPIAYVLHRRDVEGPLLSALIRLAPLPPTPEGRDRMFFDLGRTLFHTLEGVPVAIVSQMEGWAVFAPDPDQLGKRPSQDSRRTEVLVVAGLTIERRVAGSLYEMRRRTDSTVILRPHTPQSLTVADWDADTGAVLQPYMLEAFFHGVLQELNARAR